MKKQQLAGDKNGGSHAKNGFLGQQFHQQQTLNTQSGFNQSITFNDSQLRPNNELNHNFSTTERTTPSSAPPVPCSGSVFKCKYLILFKLEYFLLIIFIYNSSRED